MIDKDGFESSYMPQIIDKMGEMKKNLRKVSSFL